MFCPKCGKETAEGQAFCASCGSPLSAGAAPGGPWEPGATGAPAAQGFPGPPVAGISPKSRLATTLLAWFLGYFGAHRFYTGDTKMAVLMLVLGIIGIPLCFVFVGIFIVIAVEIWALVDFIFAVVGKFKDSDGLLIERW